MEYISIETNGFKKKIYFDVPLYAHKYILEKGFTVVHKEYGFHYENSEDAVLQCMGSSKPGSPTVGFVGTRFLAEKKGMAIDFMIPIVDEPTFIAIMDLILPILKPDHPFQKVKFEKYYYK